MIPHRLSFSRSPFPVFRLSPCRRLPVSTDGPSRDGAAVAPAGFHRRGAPRGRLGAAATLPAAQPDEHTGAATATIPAATVRRRRVYREILPAETAAVPGRIGYACQLPARPRRDMSAVARHIGAVGFGRCEFRPFAGVATIETQSPPVGRPPVAGRKTRRNTSAAATVTNYAFHLDTLAFPRSGPLQ